MNHIGGAAPGETVAAGTSTGTMSALLSLFVQLDAEKKATKKVLEEIEEKISKAKEQIKDLFVEMGVSSIKSNGKNIYIAKQIWAGINPEIDKSQLLEALVSANMQDFITCGTQKLSGYVREIIQEHPEFMDSDGNLIASPEEIAAALPESINSMVRVSETVDIRIRK
jgi:hypothetical protein